MSTSSDLTITVTEEDLLSFKRLDQFLSTKLDNISRNQIKTYFEEDRITSPNSTKKIELKKMPKAGTIIEITKKDPIPTRALPENIPLDILFEDEHILLVNKVAGMVTHPAPGNYTGTLVNAVLHHCDDLKPIGDEVRPGIVHRLDKGTSGVMIIAKSQAAHQKLVNTFQEHNLKRKYWALALNTKLSKSGTIETTINRNPSNRLKMTSKVDGKMAITHYKVIEVFRKCSLVELTLETGRTHQIRVHLSEQLNAPILNDSLYGNIKDHKLRVGESISKIINNYEHPFLHAKVLGLKHPITDEELYFETGVPTIYQDLLDKLRLDL